MVDDVIETFNVDYGNHNIKLNAKTFWIIETHHDFSQINVRLVADGACAVYHHSQSSL